MDLTERGCKDGRWMELVQDQVTMHRVVTIAEIIYTSKIVLLSSVG
jgi:hypothetical protein